MKISPLVIVALVSFQPASAFVPNTSPASSLATSLSNLTRKTTRTRTTTICSASTVGSNVGNSPTQFPYDDDAIRFAYDEWRLMYGKGDFDRYRFENFKTNYKTLTMANIQARDKALQTGQPIPQWMSLNEYGDYSVAEYEAMLEGRLAGEEALLQSKKAPFPGTSPATATSSNSSYQYSNGVNGADEMQDQYGRPIRSTQVVQPGTSGTQVVMGGPVPRGFRVIQRASQQPAFDLSTSYNGYGGEEYQDQFGRTFRPTQVVQRSNQQQQPFWSAGTQVIQQSSDLRGTQVVIPSGDSKGGAIGTQVIQKNAGSYFAGGTQVIQSNSESNGQLFARGTQVVKSTDGGYSSSDGTQLIQSYPYGSSETQVLNTGNPSAGAPTSYGTQVIKKSDSQGTQVIAKSQNGGLTNRGTLGISKEDKEAWSRYSNDLPASAEDEESFPAVEKRGTMVIKRQILEPKPESSFPSIFDFFDSGTEKEARETVIIDKKPANVLTEESKSDRTGLFSFFGGSKSGDDAVTGTQLIPDKEEVPQNPHTEEKASILSLFSRKQSSSNSKTVRGTIIIPGAGKTKSKKASDERRKTVLIPKKMEDNGLPSVLSFFGGAKNITDEEGSRDPNTLPMLIMKKPKAKTWSFFPNSGPNEDVSLMPDPTKKNDKIAAQLAKQRLAVENAARKKAAILEGREAKRKELQEKRRQATERRISRAQGKSAPVRQKRPFLPTLGQPIMSQPSTTQKTKTMPAIKPPLKTPQLSFFGAGQVPEVRRWRQNFDGSITGMIYNSKKFEDGTKVTTSPVPRGAKKGTTVVTSGGTKYFLQ